MTYPNRETGAWVVVVVMTLAAFGDPIVGQTPARPDPPPTLSAPSRLEAPRVSPLPQRGWTSSQRDVAERYASLGDTGNLVPTLLNAPELAESVLPFLRYTSLYSTLSARERAIVILRTAWLAQSAVLWDNHVPHAQAAGLSIQQLRQIAVGPNGEGWDPFESTLIAFVDELFVNSSVTDATWAALSSRFDLYNMVDAVMTVAEFTTLSIVANSLGIQVDSPGPFPLPTDVAYRVEVRDREPALTLPRIDPVDGDGLRVTRTIARHPQVSEHWRGNTNYVNRLSPLSPHDRELLILRIGWNCQAEYEWAKHVGSVGRARDHGLEPRRIAEGPAAPGWQAYEVALLEAADDMYRDAMVSDRTWNTLRSTFDTHEMMSVVMTVATYRFVSMTLNAFGVQLRDDDEGFPTF